VKEHKSALTELCLRENAQCAMGGLTPINKDIIATVFDLDQWSRQYVTVPHRFHPESGNSTGMAPESAEMAPESAGMTGFQWNGTGMA